MAEKGTPRKRTTTPDENNRRKSTRKEKTTNHNQSNPDVQKTTAVSYDREGNINQE